MRDAWFIDRLVLNEVLVMRAPKRWGDCGLSMLLSTDSLRGRLQSPLSLAEHNTAFTLALDNQ